MIFILGKKKNINKSLNQYDIILQYSPFAHGLFFTFCHYSNIALNNNVNKKTY